MTNAQIEKLARIFNGEKVVATDDDMSTFENLKSNGALRYLVSDPNPNQVGTKDLWLAYILPTKLTEAQLLASGICGDSCPHANEAIAKAEVGAVDSVDYCDNCSSETSLTDHTCIGDRIGGTE